jgi:cyclophilin family peptidyl-prolyl cis-trans isomerase
MILRSPRPLAAIGALALAAVLAGCAATGSSPSADGSAVPSASGDAGESGGATADCPTAQPDALPAGETRTVTLSTGSGDIVIKVEADLSPIAAGNFVALAACGWYDGVVFHRLVPGFVIQGGDGQFGRTPNVDADKVGTGGPPYTITDEPVTAQYARGVVAMARTSAPNSVGSQFFIVLDDAAAQALASYNTYQIIGHVTTGMDAVDAIAAMPNSGEPNNAAIEDIPITKVTVATP